MNFKRSVLILFLATISTTQAKAYYSTMTTGDLIPEGKYEVMAESQFITDQSSGVNFLGRLDGYLSDELNFRSELGFGVTDFQLGAFLKWVPIPDYEQQPAIGGQAGLIYARYRSENEVSLRLHPLISKLFRTDVGDFNVFSSLPLGLTSINGENIFPVQLVLGTQYKHDDLEDMVFLAEVGFNLSDAFTYISVGAKIFMDDTGSFSFQQAE